MPIETEAYVVHEANGPFKLEQVQYQDVGEHELLIEPVAVSLCHTDVLASGGTFMMTPPMIPGHESSGIVKQVGSHVTAFAPGDKVILSFAPCHTCRACLSGRAPYCKYLQELNFSSKRLAPTPTSPTSTASSPPTTSTTPCTDSTGAHLNNFFFGQSSLARLVLAHENGAIKLDPSVTKDELIKFASLGCGIQTGAGAVLNIIKPGPSSTIAIIGAGAVGLAASFMASLYSPHRLILIDNSATKLANLPGKHGATHLIDSSKLEEGELVEKLMELTDGEGVEYVIDAVGSPQVLRDGHRAMAKGGMIVTLGGIVKDCGIIINEHLVKGGTWRGTHQGDSVPRMFIPKMIQLWRDGKFPFDSLLSYYRFEELHKALEDVHSGKIIKPVLTF